MNFNVETIGATRKKISVEVPVEKVRSELESAAETLRRQTRLKGFRPGKAPKAMLKRLFGAQLNMDVAEKLINQALPEALKQIGDALASRPVLEDSKFSEDGPFQFSFSVEVKPQFDLTGYMGLNLTREKVNVTDEMIARRLEELRQAYAATRSLEETRPLRTGDLAVIDYQAYKGETPLEGGSNPQYLLEVGSGHFHGEFEAGLVGLNKNEAKEITVTFPTEHYNPKLAGQTIRFTVKLVDIKEKIIPELNDEFAKDLGQDLENLAQLKERIRQDLLTAEKNRAERKLLDEVQDKLLGLVELEAPESLVKAELEAMLARLDFNLKRSGLSMEHMDLKEEKIRENYQPEAIRRVKTALLLEKIAKDQGVAITDDEVQDSLLAIARDRGQTPEAVREFYSKNNLIEQQRDVLLTEKTLKFILDNATIEDVEATPGDGLVTQPEGQQG
ncbi:MAG: trigger factor [Thermodesulfobacteriota bacterium]